MVNHEFHVTVYGENQLQLVERAIAQADGFYGPGNWREDMTAFVTRTAYGYKGEYYFTDVPLHIDQTLMGLL